MTKEERKAGPGEAPRVRTVIHPGAPAAERWTSWETGSADQFRLWIAPGVTLLAGLAASVVGHGFDHACIQLFDGVLAEAWVHTPEPDPQGKLVATYGPAARLEGGAYLVSGNATLGRSAEGKPVLHCHAVAVDGRGRLYGGHLPAERCIVGEGGVRGWGIVSKDGGFVQRFDPETLFTIMFPTGRKEDVR